MSARLLFILVAGTTAVGCGTAQFKVPADEVQRLATLPVAERGQEVRVIPWDAPPPDAAAAPVVENPTAEEPVFAGDFYLDLSAPIGGPVHHPHHLHPGETFARPVVAATPLQPGPFRGTPVARAPTRPPSSSVGWLAGASMGASTPHHATTLTSTHAPVVSSTARSSWSSSSSSGHHHGGGGGGSSAGAALAGVGAAVAVVSIIALLASAEESSEREDFARTFNGWVTVGKLHLLHVKYQDGTVRQIPLSYLKPADAVDVDYAYLDEEYEAVTPLSQATAVNPPVPVPAPSPGHPAPRAPHAVPAPPTAITPAPVEAPPPVPPRPGNPAPGLIS